MLRYAPQKSGYPWFRLSPPFLRYVQRCFVAVAIVDEVSSPMLSQPEQNNEGSTECVRNPEKPGFCVAKSRPKNQLKKYKRLSNIILLIIMRAVYPMLQRIQIPCRHFKVVISGIIRERFLCGTDKFVACLALRGKSAELFHVGNYFCYGILLLNVRVA